MGITKIAILEDNEGLGNVLKIALEAGGGYTVYAFKTVKDFLLFLGTDEGPPVDLIIVDYRLQDEQEAGKSGLTGENVIRRVKGVYPDMRAILISADPSSKFGDVAREIADIATSIQKPFTMRQLLSTIKRLEDEVQ